MPLQNRVRPDGALIADPARGTWFGNRGGRFHRDDRTLGRRRWTSRRWIYCRLSFHGRHRSVWADGYTELFFLDEATAFAAGHRPCAECQRARFDAYARLVAGPDLAASGPGRPWADEIDRVLHEQRMERPMDRPVTALSSLPAGTMVRHADGPALWLHGRLFPWSPGGYGHPLTVPNEDAAYPVVTPALTRRALAGGFAIQPHPSVECPRA